MTNKQNSVTLVAVEFDEEELCRGCEPCRGCVFSVQQDCAANPSEFPCLPKFREDGRDIIWVVQEGGAA
jgi:hypothetical protein